MFRNPFKDNLHHYKGDAKSGNAQVPATRQSRELTVQQPQSRQLTTTDKAGERAGHCPCPNVNQQHGCPAYEDPNTRWWD